MKVMVRAPGRLNLIGEHTDYNSGFVLPMAINMGITLTAELRHDNLVNVLARDFGETFTFSLSAIEKGTMHRWWDYIAGTCWSLLEENYKLSGADIEFEGDIPRGAGLSSSAALEVAVAAAMTALNGIEVDHKKLALICQKAENDYVGVKCGIMDQFASALALTDNALFIDCRSLEYEHVKINPDDYIFVIINSRVKRSLANSAYNNRREECKKALYVINSETGLTRKSLREVTEADLDSSRNSMPGKLYRRALFVVQENKRVINAVKALKKGNKIMFGELMNSSHDGLRDLYEVSCRELDMVVDISRGVKGVAGARMTGAGFGGCAVSLVHKNSVDELQRRVLEGMSGIMPESPCFYVTNPAGGFNVKEL